MTEIRAVLTERFTIPVATLAMMKIASIFELDPDATGGGSRDGNIAQDARHAERLKRVSEQQNKM